MKNTILFIFLLSIVSCKTYQPQATSVESSQPTSINKPEWVTRKPSSNDYYIGIGNASLSDPDYQINAKLEALDDLASEIKVTVESSSLLYQIENSIGFNEQFQSAIKSTTEQSLELHEQVASFSDDKFYWVQYRLSKSEFARLKNEKKEAALAIAKDHFINGNAAEQKGNTIQSLHFYAQSIEAISGYLNEPNAVQIDGAFVDISVEAYANIVSILDAITLESEALTYQLTPNESSRRIIAKAVRTGGQSIHGLPITIDNKESKITNQKGEIYLEVNRRSASETLLLKADLGFLQRYPVTNTLTQGLSAPQLEIRFVVPTIKMSITTDEQNLGEEMTRQLLLPVIKELLTEKGYRVVDGMGDYQVEIHSDTRKGGEISGLFTSYLDVTLDIKNESGDRILSDSFSNIKGIHTSYQSAGMKAYQNAASQLKTELETTLNKNFINKD